MSLGLILPTIQGREQRYEETLQAYRETIGDYEVEIVTPLDYPTVGEAWNEGARSLTGEHDYLHFAIDDQVPDPGWLETAIETVDLGYLPAARQRYPDGRHDSHGSLGFGASLGPEAVDWTPCRSTGIPFCSIEQWQRVGEFLPIHYYCDDDWFWRATVAGYLVVYREGYSFTHHHMVVQSLSNKARSHQDLFIEHASKLGPIRLPQETR